MTGHGGELVESSSQQGLRRRRPDDQTCSGNVVARRADNGWRSEDIDDWHCRRMAAHGNQYTGFQSQRQQTSSSYSLCLLMFPQHCVVMILAVTVQ